MSNLEIRQAAAAQKVKLWEIAERLGVNDATFSRKLRRELSDGEQQRIFTIIDEIAGSRTEVQYGK